MLFNTLAYAKFFVTVFLVSWLLAERRWALFLPWLALGVYVLGAEPRGFDVALIVLCFGTTGELVRRSGTEQVLASATLTARVVLMSYSALAYCTLAKHGLDPLSLGLRSFALPVGSHWSWRLLGLALGAWLLYRLVRAERVRLWFLLGASYVFYAHWDIRFLPLLIGSSTVDWWLGQAIASADDPRRRKRLLLVTVLLNLGVLAVFKYFRFGVDNARAFLATLGVDLPTASLEIALPIGISFFTFESMSYVIDVYRRQIQPHRSYLEYLCFVAFFPHLVAGPIVRPKDLLPQLSAPPRWSSEEGSRGLFLIALGLTKKVAIGDYLALNLVDRVFDAPAQYSSLECYAAVVGYAIQIYSDFSGYTDVAIGSALLIGIRFPTNFDSPYKAANIQDFWRRWHISLSSWLRDYLYVSLGGNRKGSARTYVNLMLTMLLGGLWHGASWTFVVWGGLHGAALCVTRALQRARAAPLEAAERAPRPAEPVGPRWLAPARHVACVALTFHFVCLAWIFFRAESFAKARLMLSQLLQLSAFHPNLPASVVAVLGVGLLSHFVPEQLFSSCRERFARSPALVQGLCLFGAAWLLDRTASAEAVPFVYFQF